MDDNLTVGKRIRVRRKIAGLKQVDLAQMAGIQYTPAKDITHYASSTRLSNIETGKSQAQKEELEFIAKSLRCHISWLTDGIWGTPYPHLPVNKEVYAATKYAADSILAGSKHTVNELAKIISDNHGWPELPIRAHLRLYIHDEQYNKGADHSLEV